MGNEELTTQDEKVHARNAKLELRTKMQFHQREWAALNEELKVIQKQEELDATLEKYKDYKFKIGTYGYKVNGEDKIEEATDGDREVAGRGKSGLVYTGFDKHSDFGWILMKEKSDYARVAKVCQIVDAVEHIASDKVENKEPYINIILGEMRCEPDTSTTSGAADDSTSTSQ